MHMQTHNVLSVMKDLLDTSTNMVVGALAIITIALVYGSEVCPMAAPHTSAVIGR
jgi:hypothetical protein